MNPYYPNWPYYYCQYYDPQQYPYVPPQSQVQNQPTPAATGAEKKLLNPSKAMAKMKVKLVTQEEAKRGEEAKKPELPKFNSLVKKKYKVSSHLSLTRP